MTARTLTAGIFGTLAGLGTLTHGIGELMQGAVPTQGLAFPSWTVGPIAEHLDGDPAMSVLPTMAASGAATTVTSVALLAASAATAFGRRGRRAIAPLGGVALPGLDRGREDRSTRPASPSASNRATHRCAH